MHVVSIISAIMPVQSKLVRSSQSYPVAFYKKKWVLSNGRVFYLVRYSGCSPREDQIVPAEFIDGQPRSKDEWASARAGRKERHVERVEETQELLVSKSLRTAH